MADTVIRVEGLGKKYRLGRIRHETLRDRLAHGLSAPGRWLRRTPAADPAEFWALRDVSFEVQRGEVLGIIGRNGAGKSTLLKVLSRITEPTAGRVTLDGRVASLLEVGTGFHPELSGRENVFLNGAILGMSRAEIRRKFDEIVAFAEVEKFLDTPVKHYSSGMYVRLAFAVAAHLEPEILIVDEVLAVGDAAFQQKCLGKMEQIAGGGRTVLFVSHQTEAVRLLCSRCVWLGEGRLLGDGPCDDIVRAYLVTQTSRVPTSVTGVDGTRLTNLQVDCLPDAGGTLRVEAVIESRGQFIDPKIGLVLRDAERRPVLGSNTEMHPPVQPVRAPTARLRAQAMLAGLPLHTGIYHLSIYVGDGNRHLLTVDNAAEFVWSTSVPPRQPPSIRDIGALNVPVSWQLSSIP